jgi:hypothetical protein
MPQSIEDQVRARAKERCEYCHMPGKVPDISFHVDHIISRQHGGATVLGNLAWCCSRCNLHKGPNLSGIDPTSKNIVPLFNPRLQAWEENFAWNGLEIIGLTPEARATVQVLAMNGAQALDVRAELIEQGLLHVSRR